MKHELAKAAYGQFFVATAPVVLVGCANIGRSRIAYGERAELYAIQDATIAACYVQLTAEALGIATCWIGAFHEDQVKEILGIPPEVRVVHLMPIGYPAAQSEARARMPRDEFAVMEKWS
jgi:nitroreductase